MRFGQASHLMAWAAVSLLMALPVQAQQNPAPSVSSDGSVVREQITRKAPPKDDLFRDPKRLMHFAQQLEARGDPDKALRFAENALALDKNYRPAQEMAARLALQLGLPEALERTRALAQAEPRSAAAQLLYADALLLEAQTKEVPRLIEKAQRLKANPADIALRSGWVQDLEGHPKAAQEMYASALSVTPDHPALMQAMALSLTLSGDGAAGLQLAQKLANMPQGDTPTTHAAIARIYAANGEPEIGLRIMQAQLSKEDSEAMRPFLWRIAQVNPQDKAWALHFSRMTREALRAPLQPRDVAGQNIAVADSGAASDVQIHRGSALAAPPAAVAAGPAANAQTWVQLASMRAQAGLAKIWAEAQKQAPSLRKTRTPMVAQLAGQYRLLIGPYPNWAEAKAAANMLQSYGVRAMPRSIGAEVRLEEMKP